MVVLGGLVLGQAILYGPSLIGRKILLPLDILAEPKVYLPQTPEVRRIEPQDPYKLDLVWLFEPARRFAASELHAGRLPMWAPYHFAGAPFIWPEFPPILAAECCTESPGALAWGQLLAAVVAGLGMYLFCRRALSVGFWPAAIAAWCYPLTGFFIFWQGYPVCGSVYWLAWLLLAVDKTARGGSPLAPAGLGVAAFLVLISGQMDVAAQTLLASGLYALWCAADEYWASGFGRRAWRATLALAAGWTLGFLLASPFVLPTWEYAQTGARMARRSAGEEDRPPAGISALPQTVLPDLYGSERNGSMRLGDGSEMESSAAAYAGVVATLLAAPLAWCSARHRRMNAFWLALAFLALSWCLNVPGLVQLLRLPGLNMMSHNRAVFAASFAILALAAIGLDVLSRGLPPWRGWFWFPAALLAGLCGWCVWRAWVLPAAITTDLVGAIQRGQRLGWVQDLNDVQRLQSWFMQHYSAAAAWCGAGLAGWALVRLRRLWQPRLLPVLGIVLVGDLLWFAHERNPQCDPALYYPPIPVLEQIAKAEPGRVIGYDCLPASLAATCGLRDIRGYDGIDPASLLSLLALAADSPSHTARYAKTQWLVPEARVRRDGSVRLSPLLDMLGVRYVVFRGTPAPGIRPAFQGFDYWALTNAAVLPRAFVPGRVEVVADPEARLRKLASPQFDPRAVACVESAIQLPDSCRGAAEIVNETPTRITLSLRMDTSGLVVLADLWDKGWQARLNGQPVPILRANHALRGVAVPAGAGVLEFRYRPASFVWGLRLAGLAAAALLAWAGLAAWRSRRCQQATSH